MWVISQHNTNSTVLKIPHCYFPVLFSPVQVKKGSHVARPWQWRKCAVRDSVREGPFRSHSFPLPAWFCSSSFPIQLFKAIFWKFPLFFYVSFPLLSFSPLPLAFFSPEIKLEGTCQWQQHHLLLGKDYEGSLMFPWVLWRWVWLKNLDLELDLNKLFMIFNVWTSLTVCGEVWVYEKLQKLQFS